MLEVGQTGYEFSVLGSADFNQVDLILDLYEKIKRGLSKKYLKKFDTGIGIDSEVVGRIGWDDDNGGEIPRLIIDGQSVKWDEFGRMLMSFEGCNLSSIFLIAVRNLKLIFYT